MAVDVVVVNYHTDDLLVDFMRSYEASKFGGCTLTVVDVESPHQPFLREPDNFISHPENIGYARACNMGAGCGEEDVILLANADTNLGGTSGLVDCYDALMAHDDWGVLGPRQVDESGRITAGGIFGTETSIGQRGWNEADFGQYNDIRDDAKSVSGSLYFIKRKLWQELTDCPLYQEAEPGAVGAFLHTPHYYEETFCSYHARAHGYKCVFYGPVQMIHHWHKAHPIGSWADQQADASKELYRRACKIHGIVHE